MNPEPRQVAMSHDNSLEEETKRILAEADSDDSKELQERLPVKDKDKKVYKNDDFNEYDVSDDKELDEKEW